MIMVPQVIGLHSSFCYWNQWCGFGLARHDSHSQMTMRSLSVVQKYGEQEPFTKGDTVEEFLDTLHHLPRREQ